MRRSVSTIPEIILSHTAQRMIRDYEQLSRSEPDYVPERNCESWICYRDFFPVCEQIRQSLAEIWPCCLFQAWWELEV